VATIGITEVILGGTVTTGHLLKKCGRATSLDFKANQTPFFVV